MKLPRDLFAVLGITPRFALELSELERRQRDLYAERQSEGPRVIEGINEAVRRLKDPVTRAEQLFQLRNWPTKGPPDPVLLERVFTDREFIDQARKRHDSAGIQAWLDAALPRQRALIEQLTRLLDGPAATQYPSHQDPNPEGSSERARLLLEELRYFSRAITAARNAIEHLEESSA